MLTGTERDILPFEIWIVELDSGCALFHHREQRTRVGAEDIKCEAGGDTRE